MSCIAFRKNLARLYAVTLAYDRMQVDGRILVRFLELRHAVLFLSRVEADEILRIGAVVTNAYLISIHIRYLTLAFSCDLRTAIFYQLALNTGTYDWCFRTKQRNSLAHHVRAHERAVSIIVLKERNKGCCDRGTLRRSYVHQAYFVRRYHRIILFISGFYARTDELTFIIERSVTLSYRVILFILSCEVDDTLVGKIHFTIGCLTIRRFDKAKAINLCINTERRNQTDIRAFRRLNRAETAIMGIVYVSHLKTCTVAAQTTRAKSRHTALMSNLSKRILLIHELRKSVRSEVAVDYR